MFLILAWRDVIVALQANHRRGQLSNVSGRNNLECASSRCVFASPGQGQDLGPAAGGVWHGADRGSGVKCRCGVVNCPLSVQAGIRPVRDCEFHPEHGQFAGRFGIGIGVRSIGGRVWQDRERFGQLLNTTISLRRMFAAVSLLVTLPIAAWMLWHNGADLLLTLALLGTIVLTIIPMLASTAWGTSAQLHGEYRRMQKLDF